MYCVFICCALFVYGLVFFYRMCSVNPSVELLFVRCHFGALCLSIGCLLIPCCCCMYWICVWYVLVGRHFVRCHLLFLFIDCVSVHYALFVGCQLIVCRLFVECVWSVCVCLLFTSGLLRVD